MLHEWYDAWGVDPHLGSGVQPGLYHDSASGYWTGWDVVHDFAPNHWTTFDYSPGIYWGSIGGAGAHELRGRSGVHVGADEQHQVREGGPRPDALGGPRGDGEPLPRRTKARSNAPWLDMMGIGDEHLELRCNHNSLGPGTSLADQALMRMVAGPKPLSFLYAWVGSWPNNNPNSCRTTRRGRPRCWRPCRSASIRGRPTRPTRVPGNGGNGQEYEADRPTYQQFMPIFDTLDAAGWNPITGATSSDSTQALERFGPDSSGAIYFVLRNPNTTASTVSVTAWSSDLGWTSSPSVTVTSLYGTAPSTSYDGNGNLVLSFGSVASYDDRVVKIVYSGTPTVPVANFSGTPTSGSAPLNVTFTDSSTQSPTAWYWDFGDGNVSTVQSPSHTVHSGGKYIVTLTASNASGQNTCAQGQLHHRECDAGGDLHLRPSEGLHRGGQADQYPGTPRQADCVAYFGDRSTNSPTAWSWNFGDGNTSTVQNPTHLYNAVGTYTVALTAYNASGNNTCTMTNLVTIMAVKAGFVASTPTYGAAPLTVTFTDGSSGPATSWSWTFGDGGTSTAQNPSHSLFDRRELHRVPDRAQFARQRHGTRAGYISACTYLDFYPTSYTDCSGGSSVQPHRGRHAVEPAER